MYWPFSLLLLSCALVAPGTRAEIHIVPVFVTDPVQRQVDIPAGRSLVVALPGAAAGDRYFVQVDLGNQVRGDISAYVVDDENLARFQRRERHAGDGKQKAAAPFMIGHTANSAGARHLVLDNSHAPDIAKRATLTVRVARSMRPEQARQLKEGIGNTYEGLKKIFIFQDFDIDVKPCGQGYGFSQRATGNITLCTETLTKANGRSGAFTGVLMHELGHTLLGQWKLPGADNEDMADEFAVQMLMRTKRGAQYVRELAEFLAGGNPWLEAQAVIQQGGRHTLSPQRIRNLGSWAQNADDLLQRWNRVLYPNMTDEMLRSIAEQPSAHDDAGYARGELVRRGTLRLPQ